MTETGIRLVAKARDPDWQRVFGADEQMLDRRNELSRVWFLPMINLSE